MAMFGGCWLSKSGACWGLRTYENFFVVVVFIGDNFGLIVVVPNGRASWRMSSAT